MRLDWQIENPLEEWHLDERERHRELEDIIAEAEIDHYMDRKVFTNAFKTVESEAGLEKRLETGRGSFPGCCSAAEGNYPGIGNRVPGG